MSDVKATVLPVYFVADESGSMGGVIAELNGGVASLLDELAKEAFAAAKVRLAIWGFSDTAVMHLPLTDPRRIETVPTFAARNNTSFGTVFKELRSRIPEDVARLKSDGYLVNRPAVFFLTDGYPDDNDNWRDPLQELKSQAFRERPNLLAFGIGDAQPAVIREIASNEQYALIAAKGTDTGAALAKFCVALTVSVIKSAQAAAAGNQQLVIQPPEGFIKVDLDTV